MSVAAIVQKDHPTIYARDLHHCVCCTPPRRTLTRPCMQGFGAGHDEFYCPHTGTSFRYSEGARTYVAGTTKVRDRDGRIRIDNGKH